MRNDLQLNEELAIMLSREIPREYKRYISHHVRNGLLSIMGLAARIQDDPVALKELERHVFTITGELEKVGI